MTDDFNPAQRRLHAITKGSVGVNKLQVAEADDGLGRLAALYPEIAAEEISVMKEAVARDNTTAIFTMTHNMKGQAPTLGQPLLGRIARSLCDLTRGREKLPRPLTDAHLEAMTLVLQHGEGVMTGELITGLESKVAKFLRENPVSA